MIRAAFLFLLILCFQPSLFSQNCYPGGVYFSSQFEINQFKIQNPTCKVIDGDVTITGFDITDLSGLSNLTDIGSYLFIEDCPNLPNLIGLHNLKTTGGLYVASCNKLVNMSGLTKLQAVNGWFFIQGNENMINLNGLQALTSIDGNLNFEGMPAMTSLSGLNNLSEVTGEFVFNFATALTNFEPLANLHSIGGGIVLTWNDQLTSLTGLQNVASSVDSIIIYANFNLENLDGLTGITSVDQNMNLFANSDLTNIDGLSSLTHVGGNLMVNNNDALPNLSGLQNLQTVDGSFSVVDNNQLQSLTGLTNLKMVAGNFELLNNTAMTSVNGLANLENIGQDLKVRVNVQLEHLDGFSHLTTAGGIDFYANPALRSIQGLSGLTQISNQLSIVDCDALTDLSGLEHIESIGGGLILSDNKLLNDINGLQKVSLISGNVILFGNESLEHLTGLEQLTTVNGGFSLTNQYVLTDLTPLTQLQTIGGDLELIACIQLKNLSGLEHLTAVGGALRLINNNQLSDIGALNGINSLSGVVHIQNNYELADCNLPQVCQRLYASPGGLLIVNNATGCASVSEVEEQCGTTNVVARVLSDADGDCVADASSQPVSDATVWLNAPGQAILKPVDGGGWLSFKYFDNGPCSLKLNYFPGANWAVCNNAELPFVPGSSPDTLLYLLKPLNACPELSVDLGLPSVFFPCADTTVVTVNVRNTGTANATGGKLAVVLPPEIDVLDTTPVASGQTGDTLLFDLPVIQPFATEIIRLSVKTKCIGVPPGKAVCWQAIALLANSCQLLDPAASDVRLNAECSGGKVLFHLKNVGNAPTHGLHEYIVTKNATRQSSAQFNLDPQQVKTIELPADGSTYRVTATRLDDGTETALSFEGCGGLTPGYVMAYWQDRGPVVVDFQCREVTANNYYSGKHSFPAGIGPDHLVGPDQSLQYTIDFRNYSEATINRVDIIDTIAPELDVNSLRPGAASHPFTWQITHGNLLQVLFDSIHLDDSTGTLAEKRGYFSFDIAQKPGLQDSAIIKNQADILLNRQYQQTSNLVQLQIDAAASTGLGCRPDGVTFTTQGQVDNFGLFNPDCSRIEGNVTITGSSIHNLDALAILQSIGGDLTISNCPNLQNLTGLNNLGSVDGTLAITNMTGLQSFEGLERLYKIGGHFWIWNNPVLATTQGMDSLLSVGADIFLLENTLLADMECFKNMEQLPGSFTLQYESKISDLQGLRRLKHIGSFLRIYDDYDFADLSGLDSLQTIGNDLDFRNLSLSNMKGLGSLRSIGHNAIFGGLQQMVDFQGLGQLDSILGEWIVSGNIRLKSFQGLDHLRYAVSANVMYNDSLLSFAGLDNLRYIRYNLAVQYNAQLSTLAGMPLLDSIGYEFRVDNNNQLTSLGDNPNFSHIAGDCYLSDNALLTDFSGLGHLKSIGGTIFTGYPVQSFAGLDQLQSIGGNLNMDTNPLMQNMQGLNALQSIGRDLDCGINSAMQSFQGLDQLEVIRGSLNMENKPGMIDFAGLDNLKQIGGDLLTNPQMTSFHGLNQLKSIGLSLRLEFHPFLKNFDGLGQLDSIGDLFFCNILPMLEDFTGLENLRIIGGSWYVQSCNILNSLEALEHLNYVGGYISLEGNSALTQCALDIICRRLQFTTHEGPVYLNSNGPGCNPGEPSCSTLPVEVTVLLDNNQNCQPDAGDTPVEGVQVKLTDFYPAYLLPTDANGHAFFSFYNTGILKLDLPQLPSNNWGVCADDISIPAGFAQDTLRTVFLLSSLQQTQCPELTTTIGLPPVFRSCLFPSDIKVQTENLGSLLAEGARTAVVMPPVFDLIATSPLPSGQSGDTLFFELGDLKPFESATVTLTVKTKCDTFLLGQTLCWEAFSSLDNPCPQTQTATSEIKLSAVCTGDSVRFTLKNVGDAPTVSPHQYRIIRNAEEFSTGSFSLNSQESFTLSVAADSATYRMEATKREDGTLTATAIENCNGLTPGQITAFWLEKGPLEYDYDCRMVVGAFDPNQKSAVPAGAGPNHLIEANTPLQYTIEFQNTGTDTAYQVLLRDYIAPVFDINSFRPVAASHPYTWRIVGNNRLEVLFSPIALPDSNVNEPASHGYFSFDIAQIPDLPQDVQLYNLAEIWFDFNPPIYTNWVIHTIGRLSVFVVKTQEPDGTASPWRVLGNPTRDQAVFQTLETSSAEKHFALYDASGKQCRSVAFSGAEYLFDRGSLPAGMYFFRITEGARQVFGGKIIVAD